MSGRGWRGDACGGASGVALGARSSGRRGVGGGGARTGAGGGDEVAPAQEVRFEMAPEPGLVGAAAPGPRVSPSRRASPQALPVGRVTRAQGCDGVGSLPPTLRPRPRGSGVSDAQGRPGRAQGRRTARLKDRRRTKVAAAGAARPLRTRASRPGGAAPRRTISIKNWW